MVPLRSGSIGYVSETSGTPSPSVSVRPPVPVPVLDGSVIPDGGPGVYTTPVEFVPLRSAVVGVSVDVKHVGSQKLQTSGPMIVALVMIARGMRNVESI